MKIKTLDQLLKDTPRSRRGRETAVSSISIFNFSDAADLGIGMAHHESKGMRLSKGLRKPMGTKGKFISREQWRLADLMTSIRMNVTRKNRSVYIRWGIFLTSRYFDC